MRKISQDLCSKNKFYTHYWSLLALKINTVLQQVKHKGISFSKTSNSTLYITCLCVYYTNLVSLITLCA